MSPGLFLTYHTCPSTKAHTVSGGYFGVYCVCNPYGLCGCDDFHGNSSFIPKILSYFGLKREADNVPKL
ncbi:hypothetical protein BJX63DRAFT_413320 [Aspergillus granulosus]|uniref:Uncharacterized protein n=1 Tax=Aspergillus granulosus TaxID=176169 RepID=A0ABR4GX11_9EURO